MSHNGRKPKRYITLDFYRGLSVWLMVFIHVFHHLYDYSWLIENPEMVLETIPMPFLIPIGFIAYVGSWNTFFILISSCVNVIAMTKKIRRGANPIKIIGRQVFTGFSLIVIGQLELVFGYWGYFGSGIMYDYWALGFKFKYAWTVIHTLQIIGWSMIINAFVHYLLCLKKGKDVKNDRRNMVIYGILAVLIMMLTPFVQSYYDSLTFTDVTFRRWLLVTIGGFMQPVFPCLSTSFVGSIFGIYLTKDNPDKNFFYWVIVFSFILISLGIILIILGMPYSIFDERTALTTQFLQLGGQIHAIGGTFIVIEYSNKAERFAKSLPVKYLRRWSMLALSVFVLQIFELFPRWIITLLLSNLLNIEINLLHHGVMDNVLLIIPIAIFVVLSYDLLLWLWAKIHFICSFEWIIINLQSLITERKSYRLNYNIMFGNIQWIELGNQSNKDNFNG